jgi:hypothetical protein
MTSSIGCLAPAESGFPTLYTRAVIADAQLRARAIIRKLMQRRTFWRTGERQEMSKSRAAQRQALIGFFQAPQRRIVSALHEAIKRQ